MQLAEEIRFCPNDPSQTGFTRAEFKEYYGEQEWESFWDSADTSPPEIRYDTDGNAYTEEQFEAFYGANYRLFWDEAGGPHSDEESGEESEETEPKNEEEAETNPDNNEECAKPSTPSPPSDGYYCAMM